MRSVLWVVLVGVAWCGQVVADDPDPTLTNWSRVSILPLAKDVKDEAAELLDKDPKIRETMKGVAAREQDFARKLHRNWLLDPQAVPDVTGKIAGMRLEARLVDKIVEGRDHLVMQAHCEVMAGERADNQFVAGVALRTRIPQVMSDTMMNACAHDRLYGEDSCRTERLPDGQPVTMTVQADVPLNSGPYEFLVILFLFDHHHDKLIVLDAKRVRRNVGQTENGWPATELWPPTSMD
jgi:hypothetical protein